MYEWLSLVFGSLAALQMVRTPSSKLIWFDQHCYCHTHTQHRAPNMAVPDTPVPNNKTHNTAREHNSSTQQQKSTTTKCTTTKNKKQAQQWGTRATLPHCRHQHHTRGTNATPEAITPHWRQQHHTRGNNTTLEATMPHQRQQHHTGGNNHTRGNTGGNNTRGNNVRSTKTSINNH
jgi:hypothetical protein